MHNARSKMTGAAIIVWILVVTPGVAAQPAGGAGKAPSALAETKFRKGEMAGVEYASDRILIKPRRGVSRAAVAGLHAANRARVLRTFDRVGGIQSIAIPAGADAKEYVARYRKNPLVEVAALDCRRHLLATYPNDSMFSDLWGLYNTGQTGGTSGVDIDGPLGWDTLTAAQWTDGQGTHDVVVAVIDTGTDYTHPDLAANMWVNPNEIPDNDQDDDNNGYIDDVYGMKSLNQGAIESGDPMDDNGHGTHTAGTIGAVGNNNTGVVGVCWGVKIMACKFLDEDGDGWDSDAIACIEYAVLQGAHIMSNSWGSASENAALETAIAVAGNAGILFVASAGNDGQDADTYPMYPAAYDEPNIVSVAATDHNDELADFSNFGVMSVDLAAPGVDIVSTVPDEDYDSVSGTSMAAPHVAGVCALLKAAYPTETYSQLKERLLTATDPVSTLGGECTSGGRLNLAQALTLDPFSATNTLDFRLGPEDVLFVRGVGSASGASANLYISNLGANVITWTASHTENWLNVPTGGTVPAGQVVAVPVVVNTNADALTVGGYADTVTISYSIANEGSGTADADVHLALGPVSYVKSDATGPVHDGASWATAFTEVSAAVAAAPEDQEIWVAAGTYVDSKMTPKDGVKLYGGFVGTEQTCSARDWNTNPTVLDGGGNDSVFVLGSVNGPETRIDGFTIRNGAGGVAGGGGIRCNGGSPRIANCRFEDNTAVAGGAVLVNVSGSLELVACEFIGNTATNYGGAIMAGEVSDLLLVSCLIVENHAGHSGAVCAVDGSAPTLINCTVADNTCISGSGGVVVTTANEGTLRNCIVWGNGTEVSAGLDVQFSCIGGGYPGTGNISTDPHFISGSYTLWGNSPCVNAGLDSAVPEGADTDVAGNARFNYDPATSGPSTVDIGAYEVTWPVVYVDDDGSTWFEALDTIQEAIDMVSPGGTVLVADGTYSGTGNVDLDTDGKPMTIRSLNGPDACIIDCNSAGRAFSFTDAVDETTVIEGFTITEGYVSYDFGGAILLYNQSSPRIVNCRFEDNAGEIGGAIYLGASSSPEIINCTFTGNAADYGSAITLDESSEPVFVNCLFAQNTVAVSGGCIFVVDGEATLINCTVAYNVTQSAYPGGIVLLYGGATIRNSIVWNNDGTEITSGADVQYSSVDGGFSGTGNISSGPLFAQGGCIPASNSPCIDQGNDSEVPEGAETDLAGNARIVDTVDMGAYEYQGQ